MVIAMPITPEERVDIELAEPLDRFGHLALEGEPAHLSVGNDLKPCCFLQGDGIVDRLVSDTPALSDEEVRLVAAGAREAEVRWGHPLDLEWAFDAEGTLHWLQARPITSLPGDLSAMDTEVAGPDHVYTRCNIGEMMPGAYCPLTASVSGRAIEYAMQMVQVVGGFQERYHPDRWLQVGYFSGHMFLNMTEGTALSSGILGNSLEQYSMSICGRVVDELVPLPPKSLPRRLVNTARLSTFALTAGPAVRRMKQRLASTTTPSKTATPWSHLRISKIFS